MPRKPDRRPEPADRPPGATGTDAGVLSSDEARERLSLEFRSLEQHLEPLRNGTLGGLSALRFRLNRLSIAALAADDFGRYLVANDAAAALTAYQVPELERMSVWDLTPGADAHAGERLWSAFLEAGAQHGTYALQGKHGQLPPIYYYARTQLLPGVHVSLLLPLKRPVGHA